MRLIDADKLMGHLMDWALHDNATEIRECMEAVKEQPTIDPVKHGRWVENRRYYDLTCSECGKRPLFYYDEEDCDYYPCLSKVCPYCGALMDEVNE